MTIYTEAGLTKEDEIKSRRTEFQKVFDVGKTENGRQKRYIIHSKPQHFKNEQDNWEDINIELNLKEVIGKPYGNHYISEKNKFTFGFRNDKKPQKFYGIRRYGTDKLEFEVTPTEIELDGVIIDIPNKFSNVTALNHYSIEHVINPDVSLWSYVHPYYLRSATKTSLQVSDFKITEEIELKGLIITNTKIGNEYIPDEDYRFNFVSNDNPNNRIWIPQPKMWCGNGKSSYDIEHKLIEENGKLLYIKYPTIAGKDWLTINIAPFYLDSTNYLGSISDGRTGNEFMGLWDPVHDDTGSNSLKHPDETDSLNSMEANFSKDEYQIYRSHFFFDTSGIDDGDTIDIALMYIYGFTSNSTGVCCQKSTSNIPLDGDSYHACDVNHVTDNMYGRFNENSGDGDGLWNIAAWNICNINGSTDVPGGQDASDGRADINKAGTTKIICREYTHDYLDVAPGSQKYNGCYYADDTGSNSNNRDPYLDITTSAPAAAFTYGLHPGGMTNVMGVLYKC